MKLILPLLAALGCAMGSPAVQAEDSLPNGANNVVCSYSHTLPDDSILYPGKPGIAMSHDFFGNTTTDGNSTGETLLAAPTSTCENVADASAYWVASLRLADGTIIKPSYQKTYYNNVVVPSSKRYLLQPFPSGIQMLAGDHMGTGPQSAVSFLCTGRNYTGTIPTDCVPDPKTGTQLNIGISFPTCWDGVNLAPKVMSGGPDNMAYADSSGVCPAGYPVRLPHISLNVAYAAGQVKDFSGAQLSMDPTLDAQGKVTQLNWGTLYTAHGDFINAWKPKAAQYMADYCMNKGRECNKEIAYNYSEVQADATVVGGTDHATNFGKTTTLVVQNGNSTIAQSNSYMRFTIPTGADEFPSNFTPTYKITLNGFNTTSKSARKVSFYTMSNDWDENTITMDNAPTCDGSGTLAGTLSLDSNHEYRWLDVSKAVKAALQAGQTTISFCMRDSTDNNDALTFSSKEGVDKAVLYLIGVNPLGV